MSPVESEKTATKGEKQDMGFPQCKDENTLPRNVALHMSARVLKGRLKASASTAWIYLGCFSKDMTTEDVTTYLSENGIKEVTTHEEVAMKGTNEEYKTVIPLEYEDTVSMTQPSGHTQ